MANPANQSRHSRLRLGAAGLLLAVIAAAVAIPLARSQRGDTAAGGQLQVVAAENFWGNIAGQIGGSHVRVSSIISDPAADPHLYESNAQNARAIGRADIVITNGVGYDDFMDKLLAASKNDRRRVVRAADVLHIKDAAANPHIWYDLPRVHEVADAMAGSFAAADPAHADDYRHNAQDFAASLQPLLKQIDHIKQTSDGQAVAYTEPVPGYLLAAAGLTVASPRSFSQAIEDGTEPSPADVQTMTALFSTHRVKALLYNSQATSAVTQKVQDSARQNQVAVLGVTETLPPQYKTYQAWQQAQLNALQTALAGR